MEETEAQVPPNVRVIVDVSSPVSQLTLSSGSPRMSLLKMLDKPVKVRFRVMTLSFTYSHILLICMQKHVGLVGQIKSALLLAECTLSGVGIPLLIVLTSRSLS